jgi:hypothetical protein
MSEQERLPLTPEVLRSLSKVSASEHDAGAVSIAREYARLIDEAASPALSKALRLVSEHIEEALLSFGPREQTKRQQLEDAMARVSATLAEHSVASDLGPKLLATLTALGLTPAGRAEKGGKGGTVTQHPASAGLSLLRGNSERRNGAAG